MKEKKEGEFFESSFFFIFGAAGGFTLCSAMQCLYGVTLLVVGPRSHFIFLKGRGKGGGGGWGSWELLWDTEWNVQIKSFFLPPKKNGVIVFELTVGVLCQTPFPKAKCYPTVGQVILVTKKSRQVICKKLQETPKNPPIFFGRQVSCRTVY